MFKYNFLLLILRPLINVLFFIRKLKGKEDVKRFNERKANPIKKRPKGKLVWINGASIGETNSALPFAREIVKKYKGVNVLITSSSITSANLLKNKLKNDKNIFHQYIPIDFKSNAKRFLNYWKPSVGFFVDSDFWPNLLNESKKRDIPMILLNGRISPKSFAKYKKNPRFAKKLMSAFKLFLAKSKEDEKRLTVMGAQNVKTLGNLKYAVPPMTCDKKELTKIKDKVKGRKVWVVSSTHPDGKNPPEEAHCFKAHQIIKKAYPNALVILAPRHPKRVDEIKAVAESKEFGFNVAVRSRKEDIKKDTDLYIADTMGELGIFYHLSDIVFMGGSLIKWGGHNPFEPAFLNTAVLTGPYYMNFQEEFKEMIKLKSVIEVKSASALGKKIVELIKNTKFKNTYIKNAYNLAKDKSDLKGKVLKEIKPYLDQTLLSKKGK